MLPKLLNIAIISSVMFLALAHLLDDHRPQEHPSSESYVTHAKLHRLDFPYTLKAKAVAIQPYRTNNDTNSETDDLGVRPAWGMMLFTALLILHLWARHEAGAVTILDQLMW